MTIAHRFIGIDVAKAHLDIYDAATAKSWRIAVARKLLVALNAMARTGRPFLPA